jgi:hypothetical protein
MLTAAFVLTAALQTTTTAISPAELWKIWPNQRFVETPAPCLRPSELSAELRRLAELYPDTLRLEEVGRSVQNRPISMVTLGHGPRTVLLWSQMHGDEPSATPALLDMADFLLSRADQPEVAAILDDITLRMIPMLNPDGSEVYTRRNFQAIDINRDALHLSTPEGRILKAVRDRYQPMLGFNLHDQGRRTAVGSTGVLATNSVLAVAGDAEGTVTPGRLLAKRACSAIVEALAPFTPGGTARFDEDWNPRAFGDNITAWGTPVVLIESGGLPPGHPLEDLTRLNFVALLTVLRELVRNDLQDYDPRVYDDLPRNRRNAWADCIVRGGFIRQPGLDRPYRADLAFNVEIDDRDAAGCGTGMPRRSFIAEVGDARVLAAGRVVDARQSLVVAPFVAGVDGWSARKWLNAEVLTELARLGVGTVFWKVSPRKTERAASMARELGGERMARLEVVSSPAKLPWLKLSDSPHTPDSNLLRDVLRALNADEKNPDLGSLEMLRNLFEIPGSSAARPILRRGRPASFLLLSPAIAGEVELENVRLSAVFIDGVEL